ncbi:MULTISPECIES: hypothetical protein [Mesorhizobium]|uniref:hypothetical protein n=1 Tax=Mesorhizobium TaxID=68287 RepID=UPI000800376B|nr:hypothetical protein [Mesorhizobium sp. AA23]OBQ95832.1 hypothetical protein A9K66_24870 [Mesorhizobium sp. AA23]
MAKDRLDVAISETGELFGAENTEAGYAALVERLSGQVIAAIGLEASGGYERAVLKALWQEGLPERRINPYRLHQFARGSRHQRQERSHRCAFDCPLPGDATGTSGWSSTRVWNW